MTELFPEPLRHELSRSQMDRILLWCVEKRASDIVFCPGDPVWMEQDGVWRRVTDAGLTPSETERIVNETTMQASRAGYVRSGRSTDYAYQTRVPESRGVWQRFRVNATSTSKGIYIVMRALPRAIPTLGDMEGISDSLRRALYPASGLVCVSGVMGSGKSTLLAAVIRTGLSGAAAGRQVLTLEDPIEFDFTGVGASQREAPIAQSQIHTDVPDWPSGVRSMTRRKGEIVMVGECRDRETLSALLSCAEQGVTVYTTVHAQDVPQTVTRMVDAFPWEERAQAASVLRANLRLIVHQRLVPRVRTEEEVRAGVPGRVALREYLAFGEDERQYLYTVPLQDLIPAVRRLVTGRGHSLLADAREKYREGSISRPVLAAIEQEQARSGDGV